MTGFFSKNEMGDMFGTKLKMMRDGPDCLHCGLFQNIKSPRMEATGQGKLNCLIVGEAPGREEDEQWKLLGYNEPTQFIGKSGKVLRKRIKRHGLKLDRDFFKINAANCRPVKVSDKGLKSNRPPTPQEIECCRPMLDDTIKRLKPKFIWLLGGNAIRSFMQDKFSKMDVNRWRGLCIPDRATGAYVLPLYHPSYLMRNEGNDHVQARFKHDLAHAVECFGKDEFKWEDDRKKVKIITNYGEVISLLDRILQIVPPWLVYDYETTGLKPYRPGHKIASISMCFDGNISYSFPYGYRSLFTKSEKLQIKKRLRKIFRHPDIKKAAHNFKYEDIWTRKFFGVVPNWGWCSMTAAHIIDNRHKFCSLNFQAYINFGVAPYDKAVKRYLVGNPFNRVDDIKLEDLLLYGGLDSLYTSMLMYKQMDELEGTKQMDAYKFLHEGTEEMAEIQWNGIKVDEEYYHTRKKEIDNRIVKIVKDLSLSKEAIKFKNSTGKDLVVTSNTDLAKLFFEVLGYEGKKTSKENFTVDKEALDKIKTPFVEKLLEMRKLEKITGTYFAQFLREVYDGIMHPNFDLFIPTSYRGSSSDPNFQNVPVRDEEAQKETRRGLGPHSGDYWVEWDYDGLEVTIAACVTKDKALMKYVTTPGTDMHRDSAADIWLLDKNHVTKKIRFYAKNGWVFPEFYGSYYANCARHLWETCIEQLKLKTSEGVPLRSHLRDQGIKSYAKFEEHCKEAEDIFWNHRFLGYREWKNEICKRYKRDGYIDTDIGFRFQGLMTRNQVCNSPIQGPAFHCLLWTLRQVGLHGRNVGWNTKTIGQIHDSGIHSVPPNEVDEVIDTINYYGTEQIRKVFPWITVPLSIEFKISEIDGNWYDTKVIEE